MSFGLVTAAIAGGLIAEFSQPRYAFFFYALIGLAVTFQSYSMSDNLEKITEDESEN